MNADEVQARADRLGDFEALSVLNEALGALEQDAAHDVRDWASLMFDKAFWLMQVGRSNEAVICASRLVDAITDSRAELPPEWVARAMLRLAEAYEADDDLEGSELLGAAILARFPPADHPPQVARRLAARIWIAHCQRRLGELERACEELQTIVDFYGASSHRDLRAHATWARGELVLCLLAEGQLETALAAGETLPEDLPQLSGSVKWAVVRVCERLGEEARSAGRLEASLGFLQAVLREHESHRGQAAQRRHHARISSAVTLLLLRIGRLPDAAVLGRQTFARHRDDSDDDTRYYAAMAAADGADAFLGLRQPDAADRLVTELIGRFIDSPDRRVQCLVARALSRDCALQVGAGFTAGAAHRADQLARLSRTFPSDPSLAAVAEACNQAIGALLDNEQVDDATALARAVIERQEELLDSADPDTCVTAYTLLSDALMAAQDPAALSDVWDGILSLGERALAVLEGLADHYRKRDDLRVVLLYTYIGRSAVLTEMGRHADAEAVAEELLLEFAADRDEQIRRILRDFRSGHGGDAD